MRTMQGAELINSTTMGSLKKIANLVKVLVDRVLIGLKMVEQLIVSRATPGPLQNCNNPGHLSQKGHPGVIGNGRPRSKASRHQDDRTLRDRWGPYGGPFHFENEDKNQAVNVGDTCVVVGYVAG